MAVGALVSGIISLAGCFICGGFLSIPLGTTGIVLGIKAKKRIDQSHGTLGGRGMATGGLVCGIIGVVLGVIGLIFLIITLLTDA